MLKRSKPENNLAQSVRTTSSPSKLDPSTDYLLWKGDVSLFFEALSPAVLFDLVITSPPYNIGKEYEEKLELSEYLEVQENIIKKVAAHTSDTGSICWQVGNHIDKNSASIIPLDIELHPIFTKLGFKLRNRIIWHFGHGLHSKKRFSGRYETVLWYTKGDDYTFNLDDVRIPSKYPGKRHYKGPKKGEYSGHPKGKNPDDVWDIPNVKSNHVEKTAHPCQFPVGLIERLVLALTNKSDLVFDPFSGVASAGVAAVIHGRRFWGAEINPKYLQIGKKRLTDALSGEPTYRPHDKPIYDHTTSKLSRRE
jgi:adenine-specific DNA-methyltransferase